MQRQTTGGGTCTEKGQRRYNDAEDGVAREEIQRFMDVLELVCVGAEDAEESFR